MKKLNFDIHYACLTPSGEMSISVDEPNEIAMK